MPRSLRLQHSFSWYHIMNRGQNKQLIFNNTHHRKKFITLLETIVDKFNLEIHCYCLMDNHYHLLTRTNEKKISDALQYLQSQYAQFYNKNMDREGQLFRGRYKSILVDSDEYLLQLSKYIHLNPTAANMVKSPGDHEWSSYGFYINQNTTPEWLSTQFILDYFQKKRPNVKYQEFVMGV